MQHPNLADLCDAFWKLQEARANATASAAADGADGAGPSVDDGVLDDASCWERLKVLCPLSAGVPVEAMLGQITRDFDTMSARAVAVRRPRPALWQRLRDCFLV